MFEVTATDRSQLGAIPWAFIDKVLSPETPQFRALICIEVSVKRGVRQEHHPSSVSRDVVFSEITLRLPALNLLASVCYGVMRWDVNDAAMSLACSCTCQIPFAIIPHVLRRFCHGPTVDVGLPAVANTRF